MAVYTKLNQNKIEQILSNYNLGKYWLMEQSFSIEAVNKTFNRIERFRAVEFERNWNIQQLELNKDQLISIAKWKLINPEKGNLSYDINSFILKDKYNGFKNNFNLKW